MYKQHAQCESHSISLGRYTFHSAVHVTLRRMMTPFQLCASKFNYNFDVISCYYPAASVHIYVKLEIIDCTQAKQSLDQVLDLKKKKVN